MRAVLMYHSIDESGSPISIPSAVFREHVAWMVQSGVRVVSLDELLALAPGDAADAVALTFDDGFANTCEAAALLADHRLPATVFVVSGHVGGTNAWGGRTQRGIPTLPLAGWADLERLAASGLAIGAHTKTHAPLPALSSAAVEDEMDRCREELRARLGVAPSWLAYPYGAVNPDVAQLASKRFAGAVTTRFSVIGPDDPRMFVPRLDMYYLRDPGAIRRWGSAGFAWWLKWVRFRRQARETFAGGLRPAA